MKAGAVIAGGLGAAWLAWCSVGAIPWGVAPAPPANPAHARDLLMTADGAEAAVLVGPWRQFGPPAAASGLVHFIRGDRHGRQRVRIDCTPLGLMMIAGEPPTRWRPGGGALVDLIAEAGCADHPLLERPTWRGDA